jgi:hypothetical protein
VAPGVARHDAPGTPAAGAGPGKVPGSTTLCSVADPGPDGILGVERSVLDRDSVYDLCAIRAGRAPAGVPGRRAPDPARRIGCASTPSRGHALRESLVCAILPAFREIAGRGREIHMIQRFLGVSIGALVTFLILWFSTVMNPVDLMPWYVAAAVIGAIASFLWPVVIGFWLGRRAKARRDESIQKEVDRKLAEQNKG